MGAIGYTVHARAQIYSAEQPSNSASASIVLSNFRSDDTPWLLVAEPVGALPAPIASPVAKPHAIGAGMAVQLPASPVELQRIINDVAAQLQMAPELLHAVIAAESRYDVRAVSPKGAIGLMQLLPATARRFGVNDPFLPRANVFAGASYLKWLMTVFDDDIELVLAAYNAGENAVIKAGRQIPPFPETQAYVPRVLAYLRCAGSSACKRS